MGALKWGLKATLCDLRTIVYTCVAIPIALYRPQIGPPGATQNGKKMAEKWILAPPGRRGKKGQKMGKWQFFYPFFFFWSIFGPISQFFGHFFPFCRWGRNPSFGHFFPISGRRPDLGSVQGNRDRNTCALLWPRLSSN